MVYIYTHIYIYIYYFKLRLKYIEYYIANNISFYNIHDNN